MQDQTAEGSLTSDEINQRMFQMMQERQRQDAEFRRPQSGLRPLPLPQAERPLTSDEINQRMFQMMQERQRQDAEFRRPQSGLRPLPLPQVERPLTSDEINQRTFQMMQERQRQDAEFRERYVNPRGGLSQNHDLEGARLGEQPAARTGGRSSRR